MAPDSEKRDRPIEKTILAERPQVFAKAVPSGDGPFIQMEIVGGPMDGDMRRGTREAFFLGRGEKNDFILRLDPMVSSTHARVLFEDGQYWREDLASRNGTFLGEERILGRTRIGPGTQFTVGRTRVEFTTR